MENIKKKLKALLDWPFQVWYDYKTRKLVDRMFRVMRHDRDELINGTPA